jgi:hypothetical protein
MMSILMLGRQDIAEQLLCFNLETLVSQPEGFEEAGQHVASLPPFLDLTDIQADIIAAGADVCESLLQTLCRQQQEALDALKAAAAAADDADCCVPMASGDTDQAVAAAAAAAAAPADAAAVDATEPGTSAGTSEQSKPRQESARSPQQEADAAQIGPVTRHTSGAAQRDAAAEAGPSEAQESSSIQGSSRWQARPGVTPLDGRYEDLVTQQHLAARLQLVLAKE